MGERSTLSLRKIFFAQEEIFYQKPWMLEGSEQHFLNAERTVNPEFCIHKKYPSGMKGKSRYSPVKEN